jgi:hypothetical protein
LKTDRPQAGSHGRDENATSPLRLTLPVRKKESRRIAMRYLANYSGRLVGYRVGGMLDVLLALLLAMLLLHLMGGFAH